MFLLEVNRKNGIVPLDVAKNFYEQAVATYGDEYKDRSFEQWLLYLINQELIIRHPSEMVEITIKGNDFLKYLLHWGRDESLRRL